VASKSIDEKNDKKKEEIEMSKQKRNNDYIEKINEKQESKLPLKLPIEQKLNNFEEQITKLIKENADLGKFQKNFQAIELAVKEKQNQFENFQKIENQQQVFSKELYKLVITKIERISK